MIRLKPGVSVDLTHHKVWLVVALAAPIWAKHGSPDLWITGANEPGHSTGPRGFHRLPDGSCQAIDLRTWSIPDAMDRRRAQAELAHVLGPLYDVLFEEEQREPSSGAIVRGEHIHTQWDPERPGTVA